MCVCFLCVYFGIMYAYQQTLSALVLMVVVSPIHPVQLGQGPESRTPVVQEVVIQVRAGGGTFQRAEAAG